MGLLSVLRLSQIHGGSQLCSGQVSLPETLVETPTMVVELGDCNIKLCHSRGCPDDCPHWRRVPGFPVFGVGQPSEAGFPKLQKNCQRRKQFGSTCVKNLWPMLEDSLSLQGKLLILMTTLRFRAKSLIWMP